MIIENSTIQELANKIAQLFDPEMIFLFGSHAAGTTGEDSDVDLLIVRASDLAPHRRAFYICRSLLGSGMPIDILVYTPEEFEAEKDARFSFLHSALKNSRLLYERT